MAVLDAAEVRNDPYRENSEEGLRETRSTWLNRLSDVEND